MVKLGLWGLWAAPLGFACLPFQYSFGAASKVHPAHEDDPRLETVAAHSESALRVSGDRLRGFLEPGGDKTASNGLVEQQIAASSDIEEWMTGSSDTYKLGGSSVRVSWASDGRLRLRKFQGEPLPRNSVSESLVTSNLTDTASHGKTFEQFSKSAEWSRGFRHSSGVVAEKLIADLVPFVEQEHPVALQECPGGRAALPKVDCTGSSSQGLFTDQRKGGPAFLVDVSVFGFDLDLFEIKLHELNDVVDLFCLYEMPLTHKGEKKPLVWAQNKNKPRFAPFRDRVMHVVIDDPDVMNSLQSQEVGRSGNDWTFEKTQEKLGNVKMTQMVHSLLSSPQKHGREVVVNFGDADEIALPQNLDLLKQCEPKQLPIDSGTWMPMGRLDRAFKPDWPVFGFPYTFGNPSAHLLSGNPKRMYGKSGRALIGGWHLTNYAYPPHRLLKSIIGTEYEGIDEDTARMLSRGAPGVHELFDDISSLADRPQWKARTVSVLELSKEAPYKDNPELLKPPLTVQCNPERFETWFGKYDRRLSTPL